MINKILQDLVNTGKVASFIDDMIVGTETKEEYDELVEEVMRRLAENDLYVKLGKYKWKVKKVRSLETIIELEGIKMKKEKVKGILD